jgi:hypothetical protein
MGPGPGEDGHMPLLRSLTDSVAHVAINLALLTELLESQPPRQLLPAGSGQSRESTAAEDSRTPKRKREGERT